MNGNTPSWRGAEEGAAAVEAGLIISVLLLLIVGSVELGRAFWTYNTMLLAVEDAGRYAMVHNHAPPTTCKAQSQAPGCPVLSNTPLANCVASHARQVLSAFQAPNVAVSAEQDTTTFPNTVTVCGSYSFGFIAPGLLRYGPLNLTSRVTVPLI